MWKGRRRGWGRERGGSREERGGSREGGARRGRWPEAERAGGGAERARRAGRSGWLSPAVPAPPPPPPPPAARPPPAAGVGKYSKKSKCRRSAQDGIRLLQLPAQGHLPGHRWAHSEGTPSPPTLPCSPLRARPGPSPGRRGGRRGGGCGARRGVPGESRVRASGSGLRPPATSAAAARLCGQVPRAPGPGAKGRLRRGYFSGFMGRAFFVTNANRLSLSAGRLEREVFPFPRATPRADAPELVADPRDRSPRTESTEGPRGTRRASWPRGRCGGRGGAHLVSPSVSPCRQVVSPEGSGGDWLLHLPTRRGTG